MPKTKTRQSPSIVVPFYDKVTKTAKKNVSFRERVSSGDFSELVAMSLIRGDELGEEIHESADEILFVVQGKAAVTVEGRTEHAKRHDAIFVKAGERHNLRNIGRRDLKLLCVCAPPLTASTGMHEVGQREVRERMRHAWEQ